MAGHWNRWSALVTLGVASLLCLGTVGAQAQPAGQAAPAISPRGRQFPVGSPGSLGELPQGRLRGDIEALPDPARTRALGWLRSFHFTEHDIPSLHVDREGGLFYACSFALTDAPEATEPPPASGAAVPVSPFPAGLIFHSRPGAANVLYLNFAGETVTNTQWNTDLGRPVIPALVFSTDSDLTTYSDAEQAAIRSIWQRIAEDYAPFNIDVTTERPATFTTRTAMALITRNTDANGEPNPSSTAGGVAYVNVFGTISYARYRPAWIYHNNLANTESYIAEAASHEIGHNMGLSHDGKTDGTEYYGGHGTGDISWGPLMGTGYNRNVSQWCKGDYYLANNTQDDLATIAGKVSYRGDDHGNTPAAATALVLTGGTNILATTPANDPANTNTANKGVLERTTDVDAFSFVTGNGPVRLAVNPWIMPSGTRGGNLDVALELYNSAGVLLLTNNPPLQTTAVLETNLTEGQYFLLVRNSGAGDPFAATPTGYTAYGSLGHYFITGYVAEAAGYIVPPVAALAADDLTLPEQAVKLLQVTYSDNVAVEVATIDSSDLRITGPAGYDQPARFVSLDNPANGTPRTATYAVLPPDGNEWLPADNGTYTVWMQAQQVGDTEGAWVAGGALGQFQVAVPVVLYAARMDTDPGWTLEGQWQFGVPTYSSGGPTGGFTGTNILAYNLAGNYPNNLSVKYATTPPINCAGVSTVRLRFQRWLRTRANDTASIQVSTNGSSWITVWSSSSAVTDTGWQAVQYTLPEGVAGSPGVRLRWGLASNQSQSDIGWNIDDVLLLGDGILDTAPPLPSLSVADLTLAGSPSHACAVTYTDDTAVRLASLDSTDLVVTGPNGYSNLVEFVGADLPLDGSPVTASYSIPAPGGTWDAEDNGSYTVILLEDAVQDTLNNATPRTVLGTFNVAISLASPGVLEVLPAAGFTSTGSEGGPFSPDHAVYTLTNAGGSMLTWSASAGADWVGISAAAGSLEAGQVTNLTVTINATAAGLPAGSYSDTVSFVNTSTGYGNTGRSVELTVNPVQRVLLTISVNNPAWGGVSPSGGLFPTGALVELLANPATWFSFVEWTGDIAATNNPLSVVLTNDLSVQARFAELLTTNYPTPLWWLAAHGFTNDFEMAVTATGANGLPVWQSYIAGLNPNDPASQLLLTGESVADGSAMVLRWTPAPDRLYSLWATTNLSEAFTPLPDALDLPPTVNAFTNSINPDGPIRFYRLGVRKP